MPIGSGSQNETKRKSRATLTASPADSPASAKVLLSPTSTKPRPPGVIGMRARNAAAANASRTSDGRAWAPNAAIAVISVR
jgi:hypothetical protein